LDIYQKTEGKGFHMNGGIGISSRLITGRSTSKDKGSFLMGGQKFLWSFILKLSEEQKIILSIFL
jgi:hypothetical protein